MSRRLCAVSLDSIDLIHIYRRIRSRFAIEKRWFVLIGSIEDKSETWEQQPDEAKK